MEYIEESLEQIDHYLTEATKYGLQNEVVLFALFAMRNDTTLEISEAMVSGFDEWVK